ncbi:MAG: SGNH/GDSL hydrolase family protein [Lentisphaeria bacterium]|nr:SGNH/GDSL hydrolase family protein [Lentisphaeria bacterium]NQZ68832.1 SGNH/GDSL hydrolase family protein [Lentisphaeria bacterium]
MNANFFLMTLCLIIIQPLHAQKPSYQDAMKIVAKKYTGKEGKVVPLGDSITHANPSTRWARMGKGKTKEEKEISKWMNAGKTDKSNGWWLAIDDQARGRSWTAEIGIRSGGFMKGGKYGLPPLAKILKEHNPQIALILLGTNDLGMRVPPETFLANMKKIYLACMANGTIPVVQTVPPVMGWDRIGNIAKYNAGLKKLAAELKIPIIDVHGEFLKRQPNKKWYLSLIVKDGAHFTNNFASGPATESNLKNCGNLLRCYLMVHKVMEIKKAVLDKKVLGKAEKPKP